MSAYCTATLFLKWVLVLRDTFQQWVLSCHGFDVLLDLFAGLGDLQGRKEMPHMGYRNKPSLQTCTLARHLPTNPVAPLGEENCGATHGCGIPKNIPMGLQLQDCET